MSRRRDINSYTVGTPRRAHPTTRAPPRRAGRPARRTRRRPRESPRGRSPSYVSSGPSGGPPTPPAAHARPAMPVPLPSSTMRLPATSSLRAWRSSTSRSPPRHTVQAVPSGSAPPSVGGACSSSSGGESGPTGTVLCAMKRCSKGMSAVSSHILRRRRRACVDAPTRATTNDRTLARVQTAAGQQRYWVSPAAVHSAAAESNGSRQLEDSSRRPLNKFSCSQSLYATTRALSIQLASGM